jgi:hypothetical protein
MGVSPGPSLNDGDHRKKTRGGGWFPLSFGSGVSHCGGGPASGKASTGAAVTGGPPPSSSSAWGTLDLVVRRRGLCGNGG